VLKETLDRKQVHLQPAKWRVLYKNRREPMGLRDALYRWRLSHHRL